MLHGKIANSEGAGRFARRVFTCGLAAALAAFTCAPSLGFADGEDASSLVSGTIAGDSTDGSGSDGSGGATGAETTGTETTGAETTGEAEFAVSLVRTTSAPEVKDTFFIEEDGTALTSAEYWEKYGSDEGEDADDDPETLEDPGVVDDVEGGWYFDLEAFRWAYFVAKDDSGADKGSDDASGAVDEDAGDSDAEEDGAVSSVATGSESDDAGGGDDADATEGFEYYFEDAIPAKYRDAATADGVAMGRLHDADFDGTWYFSREDERFHLVRTNGKDVAAPSPKVLEALYEEYGNADDEGEGDSAGDAIDDTADANGEADDEGDASGDDGDDGDDSDDSAAEDDESWEERTVGYAFDIGEDIEFQAAIDNTGNEPLTITLDDVFTGERTASAVNGVYPLDGSGTKTAFADIATGDEGVDEGESSSSESDGDSEEGDDASVALESDEDSKANSDSDSESDSGSDSDSDGDSDSDSDEASNEASDEISPSDMAFSDPVFTSVTGKDVAWNNEDESLNATVAPNFTIPAGGKATVTFKTSVEQSPATILAATADGFDHGYENAVTASVVQDDAASSSDDASDADGENGATGGSSDTASTDTTDGTSGDATDATDGGESTGDANGSVASGQAFGTQADDSEASDGSAADASATVNDSIADSSSEALTTGDENAPSQASSVATCVPVLATARVLGANAAVMEKLGASAPRGWKTRGAVKDADEDKETVSSTPKRSVSSSSSSSKVPSVGDPMALPMCAFAFAGAASLALVLRTRRAAKAPMRLR